MVERNIFQIKILSINVNQVFRNIFPLIIVSPYLNKIATGFESGFYTGMILIDSQKSFDTINHDFIIKKLEFIGSSEEITEQFKSYLLNSKFKVHNNPFIPSAPFLYLLKTLWFSDVFRGQRKDALGTNRLRILSESLVQAVDR